MKIFSNYKLYKIPYYYIKSVRQLDFMHEGVALLDEMWRIVDCITPDTMIATHNNIIKATDSFFKNPFLSMEGNKIVNSIPITQGKRFVELNEKLLKIRTRTREIKVSKGHRFFAISSDTNFYKKNKDIDIKKIIKEKKAEELRKGDRVLLAYKLPEPDIELINESKSQLLGYILADGNIEYPHRYAIHIDDSSLEGLEKYKELAEKIGFTTSIHKHKNKNCYRLRLFRKEKILELLEDIRDVSFHDNNLKHSTTKMIGIPEKIIKSNNKILGAFLRGFFDGEGSIDETAVTGRRKYMRIELGIKNKEIIEKIKYLLLRFGIDCNNIKKNKNNGFGKKSYLYKIKIKDQNSIKIFKNMIGFQHPKKMQILKKIENYKYRSKRRIYGDLEIGLITEIEEIIPDIPYLIDFSIPSHENYIANGFIVHNSRMSRKASNKFVSDILARSRKRRLVYIFTAQVIDSIDKRIRKVMDFTCLPVLMGRYEQECKCLIFRTGFIKNASNYMKTFYFNTEIPMICYDSEEEVDMEEDTYEEGQVEHPKIIWQEAKAKCKDCGELITMGWECPTCDSKNIEEIQPIFFNTWEEANAFGGAYWEKKLKEMNIVNTERDA